MSHQVGKHKKSCHWCFKWITILKGIYAECNIYHFRRKLPPVGKKSVKLQRELADIGAICENFDGEEYPQVKKERFR